MLHQESKASLDSIRAVVLIHERIVSILAAHVDDTGSVYRRAQKLKEVASEIAVFDRQAFDEAYRATVMDPLTRLAIIFPEAEDLAKKRAARLLDLDVVKTRVRKSAEHPSRDTGKLPRVHNPHPDRGETLMALLASSWKGRRGS